MKITLIALHYGEEGSGGARRSYLWVKGLRAAGHDVYVVSPYVSDSHPHNIPVPYAARSENMHQAPTSTSPFFEKYIKRHLRVWLRWPDPEVTWHREIVECVKTNVGVCDWLITSSPSESAHSIGGQLASKLEAKWCAEFRDSWIEDSHRPYMRGLRCWLEKQFAKHWLKTVDAITAVNEEILIEAKTLSGQKRSKQIGHFSEPFEGIPASLPIQDFNLIHAGGFERSDRRRSLKVLLNQLTPYFQKRPDLHLHLIGPLTFEETNLLKKTKLNITHHGWVPLSKSRALQAGADAVLLYTPQHGSQALPGKYAEYCNLRKPIVFFGSEDIRNKAHRHSEFLSLEDLVDFPKNQITPVEKQATVSQAIKALLELLG